MTNLPPFPNRYAWLTLIAFTCLSAALGIYQGFSLHPRAVIIGTAILVAMLAVAHIYTVWRPEPQFAYPAILVAYFAANGLAFGPLSYILASLNLPLCDKYFAAIDVSLGFDWLALQRYTASSQLLSTVAGALYNSSGFQMFVVWIVLGLTGQLARLSVFLTAMVFSTATCVLLSGLFPAMDAYFQFKVPASDLGFLNSQIGGLSHMHDLAALREGSLRMVDLSKLAGIVTFPSFHTVVALSCGWALCRSRWIGAPAIVYSGLIVLTTLPYGGHYLVDVVAAGLITWASIRAASHLETRPAGVAGVAPVPSSSAACSAAV